MLKRAGRYGWFSVVACFAFLAFTLAVSVTLGLINRYGYMSGWEAMKRSAIVAAFVVMGFVMIAYLVRGFRTKKLR